MTRKIAIIGAGHNGLVAACYMAKAGYDVTVYEARDQVGGLASTMELFPGFRSSALANWHGMLMPEIIADFDLASQLKTFKSPFVSLHMPNDEHICFAENIRHDRSALFLLHGMSESDEKQWHRFWVDLGCASKILHENIYVLNFTLQAYQNLLADAGLSDIADSLFAESFMDYTLKRVDHPSLAAAILTMNFGHPCSIGSLYEVIYLGIANAFGKLGQWGFLQGGMGRISELLFGYAIDNDVKIHFGTPVIDIQSDEKVRITSHKSTDDFDIVMSSVDPITLYKMLPGIPAPSSISNYQPSIAKAVIHLKIRNYPCIPAFDKINRTGAKRYQGSIDFAPNVTDYTASFRAIENKEFYTQGAVISSHIPSSWDETMRNDQDSHLWSLVHNYASTFFEGGEWNEKGRTVLLESTLQQLRAHVTNLDEIIEDIVVFTPADIKNTFLCQSISCVHLPMTKDFTFENRFVDKNNPYATAAKNVYMCGAGTFPNGNVSGAPAYLCSHHLIQKYGQTS